MGTIAAAYRNRMQVAWRNVRANRGLRPADIINGFKMIQPLRALNDRGPTLDMAWMAMEMFTRLAIQYQPRHLAPVDALSEDHVSPSRPDEPRVGLFVDAPDHLSGVGMTLSEWRWQARRQDRSLTMHTCGGNAPEPGLVQFPSMGSISLEAYAGLVLHIPRMDEVLRYIDRMSFDVIHVSTPGPMGLLGLLAARRRGLPVCGTYHTDFPRYAGALTGDPDMEEVGWQFMRWFYGQLDRVAAPTESIRRELIEHGFDERRLVVVGRGVNTQEFSPAFRSGQWREATGARASVKLLYVGRISREKNLEVLVEAMPALVKRRPDIGLVVVGDGPYRAEMESRLHGLPVHFAGVLSGRDLATAYASSDLFVFPSKTDTFGRVVLEAQASGLPVIVSGQGGPKDAMRDGLTGWVVEPMDADTLARAVDAATDDPARLAMFSRAAARHAAGLTPEASFEAFWNLHRSLPMQRLIANEEVLS